jgi:hypothetical protein
MSGITGVAPGSVAVVNLPVGQRYHRAQLNCTGVNYTGGVAIVPTITNAAGFTNTTGTVKLNCVNGVPTSLTFTAGNSAGAAVGTTLTVPDSTGAQVVSLLCTVAGTGALGNATFTIVAASIIAGPIPPSTLITSLRILVNGVVIRDISPLQTISIMAACGYVPQYGTLPIWFTDPTRNALRDNELTSWDLAGQSTFQLQFGISANVTNPGVTGLIEFDFNRNARAAKTAAQAKKAGVAIGAMVPFLQPVAQHSFSIPITSGRFDVTQLPWGTPITRLWLLGSVTLALYQVEVIADGNIIYQATAQQMAEDAAEYGFQVGSVLQAPPTGGGYGNGQNQTAAGIALMLNPTTVPNGPLSATQNTWVQNSGVFPFDGAVIFDIDNRPWKALRVSKSLILRVYSNSAQNLTVIQESLPGAFNG